MYGIWYCRSLYKGKDTYPTIGYNCTVDHTARFISVAEGIPGAYNDKTKIRFDALANSMQVGKYSDIALCVGTVGGAWKQLKGLYIPNS